MSDTIEWLTAPLTPEEITEIENSLDPLIVVCVHVLNCDAPADNDGKAAGDLVCTACLDASLSAGEPLDTLQAMHKTCALAMIATHQTPSERHPL